MSKDPNPFKSVEDLLKGIENKEYVIPNFQRKYEWNPGMVSDLFVSIMQDYFTGLLLFWELPDNLTDGDWDPLWGAEKPNNPYFAILDGQQRLSSLYYAIYGPKKKFPHRNTYYIFFLDLKEYLEGNYDEAIFYKFSKNYMTLEEIKNRKDEWIQNKILPLKLLRDKEFLNYEFNKWTKSYTERFIIKSEDTLDEFIELNDEIKSVRKILDYKFVTHTLGSERDLSDICGIFAKINQSGMRLSTFDLMNAFLFPKGIKLRNIWEKNDKNELKNVDRSMNEYILKSISLYKQDYCSSKYIFYLIPGYKITKRDELEKITLINNSDEFIKLWNTAYNYTSEVVESIIDIGHNDFGAVKYDFIQNKTIIPVMGAIRWKFKEYKDINEKEFENLLFKWYWFATISGDYSGSSDSIMSEDYRDFKKWFKTQDESVIRRLNRVSMEDIKKLDLKSVNKGSSLYNTILCLLALNKAEDFYKARQLGAGSFKGKKIHDHHIFPKNVKKLQDSISKDFKNTHDSILNRTLLLDKTNEIIKNKKPSEYLKQAQLGDNEFKELMARHYISKSALEYLKDDNYDGFIVEREKAIKLELIRILDLRNKIESPSENLDTYLPHNEPSWTPYELIDFLNGRTTLQKIFFAAITECGGNAELKDILYSMNKISNGKLDETIRKIDGKTVSGITSGLTRTRNKLEKESIFEVIENKNGLYFKIKEQYGDLVNGWVKSKVLSK